MKALIIVDVQNDFCPGGALAVKGGDEVVPVANGLQRHFELVLATQDWHPKDHKSFASNNEGKKPGDVIELAGLDQVMWPDHCVQGSPGAEFHPGLDTERVDRVFRKGMDVEIDSYSAFFDNGHRKATGLDAYLKQRGVSEIAICGLATDYCVRFTSLDAVKLGYTTTVVIDGCRGVDLSPGDVDGAIDGMRAAGVAIATARELTE